MAGAVPPPKSAFSRLLDHFHEHPRGRLHEMLFWSAIGLLLAAFAYLGVRKDWISEPIGWLIFIVAVCFLGFAVLPHPKKHAHAPAAPPKGKRGQIAQQVKASKAEKRKGPPPPIH